LLLGDSLTEGAFGIGGYGASMVADVSTDCRSNALHHILELKVCYRLILPPFYPN